MKRIVRLTESDLTRIVRRVINESSRNMINEDYNLKPVPANYSVGWMNGLLGVVEPTPNDEGGYQVGFSNDASKNKKLKVVGFLKPKAYPFSFKGGKAIVQADKFSFTLMDFDANAVTTNVDGITDYKEAMRKGYKYYFVVDTASDGTAVYDWQSSSGKKWNANALGNTEKISSVSWGASTEP